MAVKMKDTNKWYLFANYGADGWSYSDAETDGVGNRDDSKWRKGGYPLIVNSYIASYNNKRGDGKYEYFYVNKRAEMVTGVQEVPKQHIRYYSIQILMESSLM